MRRIIVTGGGTGIGRAVASLFAEHGDQVVITGRRPDVLETTAAALGPSVRPLAFDATDPQQIEAALGHLPAQVDVLVHSAGGNTDIGSPEPAGLAGLAAAWRANLDANLLSAVLVTAALRDRLVAGGAVVNISSIAAHRGAGSYGAAKAAVEAWNLTLAQDLGTDRITANVIAPGYIEDTERTRRPVDPVRTERVPSWSTGDPEQHAIIALPSLSGAGRDRSGGPSASDPDDPGSWLPAPSSRTRVTPPTSSGPNA
jgi:3-oxoacyl-[acyl-carrier protein] reductase